MRAHVQGELDNDRSENLDGWWHVFWDSAVNWESELAAPVASTPHVPSVGWEHLDDHKESVRVPGAWQEVTPGYCGVAWYWRPFVVPDGWHQRQIKLHLGAVCGRVEIFIDNHYVINSAHPDGSIACDLPIRLTPERLHTLTIRVINYDDTGGIRGPVDLIFSVSGRC